MSLFYFDVEFQSEDDPGPGDDPGAGSGDGAAFGDGRLVVRPIDHPNIQVSHVRQARFQKVGGDRRRVSAPACHEKPPVEGLDLLFPLP